MQYCLCDDTFSHYDRTLACDRHTMIVQTQGRILYSASMASHGKKVLIVSISWTEKQYLEPRPEYGTLRY